MKKNPIFTALNLILRNTGKTLHILKCGLLKDETLRVTDLDHELDVPSRLS